MGAGDGGESSALGHRGTHRLGAFLALGVIASLTVLLAARPIFAVDLFWLLSLGREIDASGAIPTTDLFSAVHPERPWIQFQWLWEWGAYRIADAAGLGGLRLVNGLLVAGGLLGLYAVSRRRGAGRISALALATLALVVTVDRFRLRPDALNFALMVPALPLLCGGYRSLSRPALAGVVGYSFLWASLHGGGVLYLIGSAALVCLGDLLQLRFGPIATRSADIPEARASAIAAARASAWLLSAATVGAALSPTTLPGLSHFFAIYGQMASDGGEWAATWSMLDERRHPLNYLIVATPVLGALRYGGWARARFRQGDLPIGQVLWVGASLLLSMLALRFVFLSMVAFWVTVTGGHTALTKRSRPLMTRGETAIHGSLAVALVLLVTHYGLIVPRGSLGRAVDFSLAHHLEPTAFPEAALAFIVQAGVKGKVLCSRKHGGPLLYYGYPRLSVLADSRHNFTPAVWDLVRRVERPDHQVAAMDLGFARFGLELAVVDKPLIRYQRPSEAWMLLFESRRSEVWQHRQGAHAAQNLRALRQLASTRGAAAPGLASTWPARTTVEQTARRLGRALDSDNRHQRQLLARIDRRLGQSGPRRHGALRALARLSIEGRDFDRARTALAALPIAADTPRSMLYRAVVAYQQGHPEPAARALKGLMPQVRSLPAQEATTALELARVLGGSRSGRTR